MDEDEIRVAVLFALQTAHRTHGSVTKSVLFSHLPKILRGRWSEGYLAKHILPDLSRQFLVDEVPEGQGRVSYALTPSGRRLIGFEPANSGQN